MLKKITSLLLAGCITLAGTSAFAFSDTSNHWAENSINNLVKEKILTGYEDNSFKPDNSITREEAATMIYKMYKGSIEDGTSSFSDVASDRWSNKFISALKNNGLIKGYEDGTFKPVRNISRAEFSSIVHDFLAEYNDLNYDYVYLTDMGNHWADSKVSVLVGAEIIKGYPDITFKHENSLTRAEASSIVNKALKLKDDPESGPIRIEDRPPVSSNSFVEATVTKVTDGDTITVNISGQEYKLRMIGVDTPESVHPDGSKNTECGRIASDYTKSRLTAGSTVYLQKDVSDKDRYGRLLRYVWLSRPSSDNPSESEIREKMYNAELTLKGYAKAATFPPDVKYADLFNKFTAEAREANAGLWNSSGECTLEGGSPAETPTSEPGEEQDSGNGTTRGESPPSYAGAKEKAYLYSNGRIIAHKYSGIYHRPGQQSYKKINVENAIFYDNAEDAEFDNYVAAER